VLIDLNKIYAWVKSGGMRSASINMDELISKNHLEIWVYDYELGEGDYIYHPDEIDDLDLEQKKIEKAKKDMERAQKILEQA